VKLDAEAYRSSERNPERTLIELSSPRYLGTAGTRGIYVTSITSYLELLKIDGFISMPTLNGSLTSLDTLYVFFFFDKLSIQINRNKKVTNLYLFFQRSRG
jgi:hypothetical protein